MIIGLSGKKQHGKDTVCKIIQYLSEESIYKFYTINQWLNELPSYNMSVWKNKKFADNLKKVVALFIGCTLEDLENEEFKNKKLGENWKLWYLETKYFRSKEFRITSKYYSTLEQVINVKYLSMYSKESLLKGIYIGDCLHKISSKILTPRELLQQIGTEGLKGIHPYIHINGLFSEYKSITTSSPYDPRSKTGGEFIQFPKWIITDVRFKDEVDAILKRNGIIIRVYNPRIVSNDEHISETSLDNYTFEYTIINDGTIEELVEKVRNLLIQLKLI